MNRQATVVLSANTSWYLYNFRKELIQALIEKEFDVVVLAPFDRWAGQLEALGCRYLNIEIDRHGKNIFLELRTFWDFWWTLRSLNPSVSILFTIKPVIYGGLAGRLLRLKLISVIPGLGTVFINPSLITRFVEVLYRIALKTSSKVGFENADDLALFRSKQIVGLRQGLRIPGAGVNVVRIEPAPFEHNELPVLLFVGRLVVEKGVYELISAARQLKSRGLKFRLQLLGTLDENNPRSIGSNNIKRWVEEDVIEYLGVTDNVIPFIRQSDAVLLPSYREGLPGTLLEACAIGRPIIGTDVPGCRELLTETRSIMCLPRSVESLLEALEQYFSLTADAKEKWASDARTIVCQKYSKSVVNDIYLGLVREIITS